MMPDTHGIGQFSVKSHRKVALVMPLRVPATRIGDILRAEEAQATTPDAAIRFERYFLAQLPNFGAGTPPHPALSPM
jgi:hypothetical protein